MADRTLDSLPFDMTNTVQKSGAHLITLLGMSSALNSLQIKTILENFSTRLLSIDSEIERERERDSNTSL